MASTLGKRKEREDEVALSVAHGSTLFVSNLPYTTTSTDLKTLFSDLAPVRSAFVVTESGSGVSKGVGYVSFAIKEDARLAFESINQDGLTLNGRSLRVQWAESKAPKSQKEQAAEGESKPKPKNPVLRSQQSAGPRDPDAIRTVVISGLPPSVDSKTLWKKVRKLGSAEKVEWPAKTEGGGEDHTAAHAIFATPAAASEAVNKLHAHVFKGSLLSATLKKRLDGLAKAKASKKAAVKDAASKTKGPAPSRASRLIIRNLPFDITEQDLRAIFLPYGPVYSVDIPVVKDATEHETSVKAEEGMKTEEDKKPRGIPKAKAKRTKGFAFVWMLSRKDAERAMEGCNGIAVRAGVAEQMVADKQKRKKQQREEEKSTKAAASHVEGDEGHDAAEGDDVAERTSKERIIAVDWALSKSQWEKEKAKLEEGAEDVEMTEARDEEGSEGDESEEESEEKNEDDHIGVHSDDDESDDSMAEDDDSDSESDGEEEEPAKPTLPPPETGTTLFVRNVPFEASEDELRTLFRAFGPLRYARITMDHETGRSRGTGFVCFWNKTDADKAVEQSEILRAETVGDKAVPKNPFKLPSLLTPDPSASIAQNLVLHGRTLDVIRAVTRDEAGKLKQAGERQREKADKRNLYLLREGIILPNTPAAESMSPVEVEKRTASFNARRALLRSNPSLYMSKTRLSIRQLPIFVTERMLKRLAIHAARTFEQEVKAGTRQPLSADELVEGPSPVDASMKDESEDGNAERPSKAKGKGFKKGRDTGVKQAKVVRQADRVDPVTGKGRSKGYGFLEMTKHADALRVLRWANTNRAVGALFEEWWKAELEDLVQIEKKKPKQDEARLKRLREELERGAPVRSKGTLVVEFSIENVQVVQRRMGQQKERLQSQQESPQPAVKTEPSEGSPSKKRRLSHSQPKSQPAESKLGQQVGSLIGRKRKERKSRKRTS
ncbi:hypothetical protein WOLCODRAFT_84595 [Wolfiporia cocos MD-104 SS10]|uniref:RRM domain-containing protein n=1 Tax=Wolfiporia cocos (strain MD-104) TaxID=742152 RepID=A0A2H3JMI9_WOLCO|nr:hypothetical protein WOLCODRAFT_84595 [Wolfiporia cocos MD-104 SS10]